MHAAPDTSLPTGVAEPGSRAAIAGLVFSALYIASFIAVRGLPQATWTDDEILAYYASADVDYLKLVTLYLVPFAGIAFLWFLAAFRDRVLKLAGTENTMLSTVQILSGAIYVAMQFAASASIVTVVLTLDADVATADEVATVRPFLVMGDTILVVFALRAAAVFMMAGTTRALTRRTLSPLVRHHQLHPRAPPRPHGRRGPPGRLGVPTVDRGVEHPDPCSPRTPAPRTRSVSHASTQRLRPTRASSSHRSRARRRARGPTRRHGRVDIGRSGVPDSRSQRRRR